MNITSAWADLESSLAPEPLFYVQAPDGRRDWGETPRQATLFRLMHMAAPQVFGFAIPNAGKRNQLQARREGIVAGIPDTQWVWHELTAFVEMKGYDRRGQAGTLSKAQIEKGNRLSELGYPVACFFCPYDAAAWLRERGFPVATIRERAA